MRVQDEGSQLAALALTRAEPVRPGERWLDLCAGPGGKTAVLAAEALAGGALLEANEISPARAGLVRRAVEGVPLEVPVSELDGLVKAAAGPGVLRPHPRRRAVHGPRRAASPPRGALAQVARRRARRSPSCRPSCSPRRSSRSRPGGIVAYVTCSPHLAETAGVVAEVRRAFGEHGRGARRPRRDPQHRGDGPPPARAVRRVAARAAVAAPAQHRRDVDLAPAAGLARDRLLLRLVGEADAGRQRRELRLRAPRSPAGCCGRSRSCRPALPHPSGAASANSRSTARSRSAPARPSSPPTRMTRPDGVLSTRTAGSEMLSCGSSRCIPNRSESVCTMALPRTLLPCASRRGLKAATPNCDGATARTPPLTPLFAGRPTRSIHSPEKSYMPQLAMTEITSRATRSLTTRSPGRRVHPAEGEGPGHDREVAHRDEHRALTEVRLDGEVDRPVDDAVRAQQVPERAVAVARSRTPSGTPPRRPTATGPANADSISTTCAVRSSMSAPGMSDVVAIAPALIMRIRRATRSRLEADRVERLAARLSADVPHDLVEPCSASASASTNGLEIDWMVNSASSSPDGRGCGPAGRRQRGRGARDRRRRARGCTRPEPLPAAAGSRRAPLPSSAVMGSTARP